MNNFDPTQESKFIQYLDANNLYGWTMSQTLPLNNFEWMTENDLSNWRQFLDQEGKVAFLRLIWSIRKNFIICIMIFHLHQRELL